MPQSNPFDQIGGNNPFDVAQATGNPFDQPSVTDKLLSTAGRVLDPIYQKGKATVGTILDVLDTPQNAIQGGVVSALRGEDPRQGFMQGLMRDKDFDSKDILSELGWQGDGLGKKAVGLVADVVLDPLNLLGVGEIKNAYQGLVKGGGALAKGAIEATPVAKTAFKAARNFIDPHADLAAVDGLKDFARLTESKARSVQSAVDQEVSDVFKQKSFGPLVKTVDDATRQRIAHAIDSGNLKTLTPEEQAIAGKFKSSTDKQFFIERRTGHQDPNAYNPNYVPYVTKADNPRNINIVADIKGTTRHSKSRTLPDLATAVKDYGASDDAAEILRSRLSSGRLAQVGADALEEAGRSFGKTTQAAGYRQLNLKNIRVPDSRGVVAKSLYYPEKVADYMEKAHAIYTKPEEVDTAIKNAVKVYKGWLVTNPQQGATNLVGNVVNAFMTGNTKMLNPNKLMRAGKIVLGHDTVPDIGKYKGADILQAMKDYEIVGGQGQYQDIFNKGKNYTFNPLKSNNAAGRFSQFVNQHGVEEPFKVAQYLQAIEDGADLKQAALKVKDTFFDYAEISEPAKKLRDYGLAPFITWQIKNIPLQLENLALRPQKFAQTESVYSALTDKDQLVPHQDEREGMLPIGDNKLMRFASPINDLNKLPIGAYEGNDFLVDTIGGAMPWFKAMVELPMNKKIYNQQPIKRIGQEGAVPFDVISQTLDSVGLGGLAGISEDPATGFPRQNEYMAYILQQNPWQYYGRNLLSPPEELTARGNIVPGNKLDKFAGAFGFRTKELTPKAQIQEIKRRLQMMEP